MRCIKHLRAFSLLGAAFVSVVPISADDGWERRSLTVTEENDSRLSDRHYTQGAKLTFLSADHERGILPSIGYKAERWKWGLEGGQFIFTPEDLSEEEPILDDRPYAGWLFGGFILQQRGTNSHGRGVMETGRLRVGVVGPESLADDTQIWWHRTFGFEHPSGWRHQLKTEVGVQFSYDRRYRFAAGDDEGWSVQFLPEGGVDLGNVRISARLSGTLRAGYNIPNEFGFGEEEHGADFGCYVFAGVSGEAVALDIFLDGNNFRHSQNVDKKPLVAEARGGVAFTWRAAELALTHVRRTHEFEEQDEMNGFTSVNLTFKF